MYFYECFFVYLLLIKFFNYNLKVNKISVGSPRNKCRLFHFVAYAIFRKNCNKVQQKSEYVC